MIAFDMKQLVAMAKLYTNWGPTQSDKDVEPQILCYDIVHPKRNTHGPVLVITIDDAPQWLILCG